MSLLLLKQYWWEVFLIIISAVFSVYVLNLQNIIKDDINTISLLKADKKLDELQKDVLRSAILDQNTAIDKQRIDAIKKLEIFKMSQYAINAKYARERITVRDLNGSNECDAIRNIIKLAL